MEVLLSNVIRKRTKKKNAVLGVSKVISHAKLVPLQHFLHLQGSCMWSSGLSHAFLRQGRAMAVGWGDLLSAVLVGAVWGCTNPFLRRGSADDYVQSGSDEAGEKTPADTADTTATESKSVIHSLLRFKRVGVWLPYLLNQSGSILYYKLLATSDLSLSVPVCNAMALVFSSATSSLLGERVDRPVAAIAGSLLVTLGVAICMASNENLWSADATTDGGDEL